jgi:hypothetical protein
MFFQLVQTGTLNISQEKKFFTCGEVSTMLMNLFILWILMSLFCGSRAAGSTVRFLFGIIVFFWVVRILFSFGLMILPIIVLVLIFSKVVLPFVTTFLRHFQ